MPTMEEYKNPGADLPATYRAWQLHGAGFENVGIDAAPETLELREPKANEVLLRVDAVGLCLSDIKIIKQGSSHARLRGRDLAAEPTVLGHECAVTVVKAGQNWQAKFHPGERFIVQADIYHKGKGYAFGYLIPGGLAQYTYVDERVLDGDEGCYLLRVLDEAGYSQVALAEPWACVEMSYNLTEGRLVPSKGRVLIVTDLDLPEIFEGSVHVPSDLEGLPDGQFDDIVVFDPKPEVVEQLAGRLNKNGIMFLVGEPIDVGIVNLDIGKIHYEGQRFYGGGSNFDEIADANKRNDLKPGGAALFVGAGGPMGQMHVQRSISIKDGPKTVVVTDLDKDRLAHIEARFGGMAVDKGVTLLTLCPSDFDTPQDLDVKLREIAPEGYSDICILAPIAQMVADLMPIAADNAIVNVFAGVGIGSKAPIPLEDLCRGVTIIGSSGSRISDLRKILGMVENAELNTNLSVAAIGGLNAALEGLKGLSEARFPGKTVIYPQVPDLPLMGLPELAEKLPDVAARLSTEGSWTIEAEEALLEEHVK